MAKGAVEVIFWIAIMIIILLVAFRFLSSFFESTPELKALSDFKDTVELVCEDGGPSASSISVFLGKEGGANPKFFKLHMSSGKAELLRCTNEGPECRNPSIIKTKELDCPRGTEFDDCWVSPEGETTQVIVRKFRGLITLNATVPGVYC